MNIHEGKGLTEQAQLASGARNLICGLDLLYTLTPPIFLSLKCGLLSTSAAYIQMYFRSKHCEP